MLQQNRENHCYIPYTLLTVAAFFFYWGSDVFFRCMVQHRVWVALGGGCGLCNETEEGLWGGWTVLRINCVVLTCVTCFYTRAFMLLELLQVHNSLLIHSV